MFVKFLPPLGLACALAMSAYATMDRIVAVVNDDVITEHEVHDQLQSLHASHAQDAPEALYQKALEHLIDIALIKNFADNNGIIIDDTQVEEGIERLALSQRTTVEALKASLAQEGRAYEAFAEEVRMQLIINHIYEHTLIPGINISNDEIARFLQTPEGIQAMHMLHTLTVYKASAKDPAAQRALAEAHDEKEITQAMQRYPQAIQAVLLQDRSWDQIPSDLTSWLASAQEQTLGPVLMQADQHLRPLLVHRRVAQEHQDHPQVLTQHILLLEESDSDSAAQERLLHIRDEILANTLSFADAAKHYSQDPGSSNQGGQLPWLGADELDPTFYAQTEKMQPGEISQPFQSQFGWHILLLQEKRQPEPGSTLQQHARQWLFEKKLKEAMLSLMQDLRRHSFIEYEGR